MNISIGAKVQCQGESIGTVKRLILDPVSFDLRQIVVAFGGLMSPREVLVPVERIYEAKKEVVTLDITPPELEALPDFAETTYMPIAHMEPYARDLVPGSPIDPALLFYYYIPRTPTPEVMPPPRASDAREITAGMDVYAGEEKVGEISEVIVDSSDKRTITFVIERGWLFTHNVKIPADWVRSIESDRILLNRTKEQIEEWDKAQQGAAELSTD